MATLTLREFDNEMLDTLKQATGERTYSSAIRTAAKAYPQHVSTIQDQRARIEELEKELALVKRKVSGFVEGLRFMSDNFNSK